MTEAVRYTLIASPLGRLAVAASARGVCHAGLGDDGEPLVAELLRRHPQAAAGPGDADLAAWAAGVAALIEAPDRAAPPPLDLEGTEFQIEVWAALCGIPLGGTTTYGALAARLGTPGGERAVAGACARNPVAVAVPCHRVLRQDGGLGGYRWGLWRKQALLEREGALLV